tara:strand:- start:1442 stop:1900 length:459 start_codon:yes stop_codon:yes gene_type:complete
MNYVSTDQKKYIDFLNRGKKMRTFKKYPNRRIYDLQSSKYVTLDTILNLIVEGQSIEVVDAESGNDLTQNVLLQILSDQERKNGKPLLTNIALEQLIRFTSSPFTKPLSQFLDQSLEFMSTQQELFKKGIKAANLGNFNIFEESYKFWSNKQ